MKNFSSTLILALLFRISVLVRLAADRSLCDEVDLLPGIADGPGLSFGEIWWPLTRAGEYTAHWSYLYTRYLALVYKLFGVHPLALRLVQTA